MMSSVSLRWGQWDLDAIVVASPCPRDAWDAAPCTVQCDHNHVICDTPGWFGAAHVARCPA